MSEAKTPARWQRLLLPSICLLLLGLIAWIQRPDGLLHLYILKTSGDAALIRTPRGAYVLIDGGNDPVQLPMLLGRLMPFWQRKLRAAVLSSGPGQGLAGQVAALSRYHADLLLVDPALGQQGIAGEWHRLVAASSGQVRPLQSGQQLELDGAWLTVLAANSGDDAGTVLLLSYGATHVLWHTGGPAGDQAALQAATKPLDLLLYPWQRELATPTIAALRPQAIVFSPTYEAPSPALLSYADRRHYAPQIYHPQADGQLEWFSDGRRSQLKAEP